MAFTAHSLQLDRLIVAARTLDEGTRHVSDALGVAPLAEIRDPDMRTHSRVLPLAGGSHLEVIAWDPDAVPSAARAPRARWFGLDRPAFRRRLESGPFLAHWVTRVVRPKNLRRWQSQYPERIPPVLEMARAGGWHIAVPDDGELPAWQGAGDGVLPSLMQWQGPVHPCYAALPPAELALLRLTGYHARPEPIAAYLQWLGLAHALHLETRTGEASLCAHFDTPNGPRSLR